MAITEPQEAPEPRAILDVHLAEYQMITNRSTYYIYIASTIWPILILFLSLVLPLPMWKEGGAPYLLWITCTVAEFSLYMWVENAWIQYSNISYIEQRLRPAVAPLVATEKFWLFEHDLWKQRRDKTQWWEGYPRWFAVLMVLTVTIYRIHGIGRDWRQWSHCWDVFALGVNVYLALSVVRKTHSLIKLRHSLFHTFRNATSAKH